MRKVLSIELLRALLRLAAKRNQDYDYMWSIIKRDYIVNPIWNSSEYQKRLKNQYNFIKDIQELKSVKYGSL